MKRRDFLRTAGGGATVAAASATAPSVAAQEDGGGQTTVDMTSGLAFDPSAITIPPGTTVVWENTGSVGHTVTAYEDDIPDDAEYFASGGYDTEQAARDAYFADNGGNIPGGESYQHTFSVTGEYGYFCIPHESSMVGTITVEEGASLPGSGDGGGGGAADPEHMGVPIQAHFVGIGTVLMVFVSLLFTFFVLKYGESPHASGGGQ